MIIINLWTNEITKNYENYCSMYRCNFYNWPKLNLYPANKFESIKKISLNLNCVMT